MLKEKRIKDYEDYGITTNGDVISYKYSTPRVMSPWKQSGGYSNIGLMKNGVKKNFGIHRLVAEAFIPNPDNLPEVGHIIPISEGGGNNVENLYWTTRKENQNDSFSRHSPVRNFINCILISPTGNIIGEFESITECAKYASDHFGCSYSSIRRNLKSQGYSIEKIKCRD